MIDEDVSRGATTHQTAGEHSEQQHEGDGGGDGAVPPCPGRQRGGRGSPCAN